MNIEQVSLWGLQIKTPLAFAFAVLIIPVFDTMRIILVRLLQGRSPLHPDRQHIHYRLVDTGLSHIQSTGILMGVNLIMIALALSLQSLGEIPVIMLLLVMATFLSLVPGYYLGQKKRDPEP